MSHMRIDATTPAGFDLGFKCVVIEDACATRDLQFGVRPLPLRRSMALLWPHWPRLMLR